MLHVSLWSRIVTSLVVLAGILVALPNALSDNFLSKMPAWLPHSAVNLGLDLQGGSYLLLEVQLDQVQKDKLESVMSDIRVAMRKARIAFNVAAKDDTITLTVRDPLQYDAAKKIVADLKLFSGHDEAELKPMDLKQGMESAIAMVQGRFTGKADFKTDMAELPQVNAYGKHLNQAFLAILTNAGQAMTTPGDVFVTLRQEGSDAVFTVRDTGVGIPAENLPKIFDPFFTTRPVGEGTGLGLTTAFTIVERHNGSLTAISTPGQGSTFTLRLPLAGVDQQP